MSTSRRRRAGQVVFRVVLFMLLISPFLINGWAHRNDQFIYDNIFQLNVDAYMSHLRSGGDFIIQGNYSSSYLLFAPFFVVIKALSWLLSPALAYIALFVILYWLASVYWRKYWLTIARDRDDGVSAGWIEGVLPDLITFVLLSSLSFYMYFNNSLFPQVGYFFLPVILYQAHQYVRLPKWWRLVVIWAAFLMMLPTNLTYILIDIILVNLITWILRPIANKKVALKRLLMIDFVIGLVMLWIVVVMLQSMIGDVSQVSSIYAESFYSSNVSLSTTLRQVSDWGFFQSWQGEPYYAYAAYYLKPLVVLLGFLPYVVLGWLLFDRRFKKRRRDYSLFILFIGVLLVMQGSNNPVFAWLYENFAYFAVFRNVAKWSFALLLLVLMQIYLIASWGDRTKRGFGRPVVFGLIALFAVYNLPFWINADSFFANRSINKVPDYWYQTADYLNQRLDASSKVLLLPAVYIGENYSWNDQEVGLKSYLSDVLIDARCYRLSELFMGGIEMQKDMNALYLDSSANDRGKEINMSRLDKLLANYHIDYFLVTHDLISDYQTMASVDRWAKSSGYKEIATFDEISIYQRADRRYPLLSVDSVEESFEKIDNFRYRLDIKNLSADSVINFNDYYHSGWRLETSAGDTSWVAENSDARNNRWTINDERFQALLKDGKAEVNDDGSINIELYVDYHPRRVINQAFALMVMASAATFVGAALIGKKRQQ